jgi:murein hydrolase activator
VTSLTVAIFLAATPAGPLAQLDALDRQINTFERKLIDLARQRDQNEEQLAAVTADLATTRIRQGTALNKFKLRVGALARMPTGARLALLGGTRSLSDYLEVTRLLRWVAREDLQLHKRYVNETQNLRHLETTLAEHARTLDGLERQMREGKESLTNERRARLDLLTAIATRQELAKQAAQETATAAGFLVKMVGRLKPLGRQSAHFSLNRGHLPWPAVGAIARRFGQQSDGLYGTVIACNGIVIRAPAGASVQAVANGTVAYADWLTGYGQVVILDHSDGYYTLMAHLASLAVAAGRQVAVGDTLGTVGDTGSLQGPQLYFELRQGTNVLDPEAWLRR